MDIDYFSVYNELIPNLSCHHQAYTAYVVISTYSYACRTIYYMCVPEICYYFTTIAGY